MNAGKINYLVPIHKWSFCSISVSIFGIICLPVRVRTQTGVTYCMYVSASSIDFLGLAQKFAFPDRKLTRAGISFMDGHYLCTIRKDGERTVLYPGHLRISPKTCINYFQKGSYAFNIMLA